MDFNYKLGVVVPNWNGEKYIKDMLNSILAQTYKDWQLFVVDDQSTDGSVDIIKDYEKRDKRVHLHIRDREPKSGQTCRNIGFEFTKGAEYVCFFDNDDILAPFCFHQRVDYMENHLELDFGVFPAKTYSKDAVVFHSVFYGMPYSDEDLLDVFLKAHTPPFVVWNCIFRRESLQLHQIVWDTNVRSKQDSDFDLQCLIKGLKFAYPEDAKVDYFYRVGQNRKTTSRFIVSKEHFESHLHLLKKVTESLGKKTRQYRQALNSFFFLFIDLMMTAGQSKEYVEMVIQIPFVQKQKSFALRLKIFNRIVWWLPNSYGLRYKLKRILFPMVVKRRIKEVEMFKEKCTWFRKQQSMC